MNKPNPNKRFSLNHSLFIRIVSIIMVGAFFCQDVVLANPGGFRKEVSQDNKLAPASLFTDSQPVERIYARIVEDYIEAGHVAKSSVTVTAARAAMNKLLSDTRYPAWLRDNVGINSHEQSPYDLLISFSSGHILRYFDPTELSEAEQSKYDDQMVRDGNFPATVELNKRLHKQLLMVKSITTGDADWSPSLASDPADEVLPAAAGPSSDGHEFGRLAGAYAALSEKPRVTDLVLRSRIHDLKNSLYTRTSLEIVLESHRDGISEEDLDAIEYGYNVISMIYDCTDAFCKGRCSVDYTIEELNYSLDQLAIFVSMLREALDGRSEFWDATAHDLLEGVVPLIEGKLIPDILGIVSHISQSKDDVNVREALESAVAEVKRWPLSGRGPEIGVFFDESIGLFSKIAVDESALVLAAKELVYNAIKYSEATYIEVFASYNGKELRVSISDDGKGIEGHMLEKMFTPELTTMTDKSMGSGVGLASLKGVMDSVGGKITVSSKVGRGATFTIVLPVGNHESGSRPAASPSEEGSADRPGEAAAAVAADQSGAKTSQAAETIMAINDISSDFHKTHAIADDAKIMLSSSLFSDHDGAALTEIGILLKSAFARSNIEIVSPDKLRNAAKNSKNKKDKLVAVFSKEDFYDKALWSDEEIRDPGARFINGSVVILEDKLIDENYLYLQGVITLARAIMINDKQTIRQCYELLSASPISDSVFDLLDDDSQNNLAFAISAILKFKPIVPRTNELNELRVMMENALIAA